MTPRRIAHSIIERFSDEQIKAFVDSYSDYKPDDLFQYHRAIIRNLAEFYITRCYNPFEKSDNLESIMAIFEAILQILKNGYSGADISNTGEIPLEVVETIEALLRFEKMVE